MDARQVILVISIIVSAFFTAVYLVAFFSWKRRRRRIPDDKLPFVSIVVPAYNEGENIGETIESLLDLDYPKEKYEIIVVDDGSTDNTYEVAKRYEGGNVRVIRKENGGKSSALNVGIRNARGEIIACMDADSIATRDALRTLVEYIVEENADAVTPVMHVWNPKNFVEKFQWAEYNMSNVMRRALDALHAQYVVPGPFSIIRREVFDKWGYFEEGNITEDMEMAMRIQANGGKLVHASDAIVYTKVPKTIPALIKQRVRWNLGFVDNALRYRKAIAEHGGDLGNFVFPAIAIGLFITFLLAYNMVMDFIYQAQIFFTTLEKGGIWAVIRPANWTINNIITNTLFGILSYPAIYYTTMLVALLTAFMVIYYAKRTGQRNVSWLGIFLFLSFYFVFMLVVWTIILLTKLFGRELRFGGTVWRNSIINRLAGAYTQRQQS